jgi:hypothetical protein
VKCEVVSVSLSGGEKLKTKKSLHGFMFFAQSTFYLGQKYRYRAVSNLIDYLYAFKPVLA